VAKEKTYSEKLKDPRWQKKRLEVLQRDNFTCQLCGDAETELHVHHHAYLKGCQPWEYELSNFSTFCKHCHAAAESLKGQYELIKVDKVFSRNMDSFVLLVLVKIDGLPKVAFGAYGSDDVFTRHGVIGQNTIRDINKLMEYYQTL